MKKGKMKYEKEIAKVLKFFGTEKPQDIRVSVTPEVKYGCISYIIKIGKGQPKDDIILTLVHELLHYKGLNHDEIGRFLGFYSYKRDVLSEWVAERIFKRKFRWSYD